MTRQALAREAARIALEITDGDPRRAQSLLVSLFASRSAKAKRSTRPARSVFAVPEVPPTFLVRPPSFASVPGPRPGRTATLGAK